MFFCRNSRLAVFLSTSVASNVGCSEKRQLVSNCVPGMQSFFHLLIDNVIPHRYQDDSGQDEVVYQATFDVAHL
jgi:hypothetical protein